MSRIARQRHPSAAIIKRLRNPGTHLVDESLAMCFVFGRGVDEGLEVWREALPGLFEVADGFGSLAWNVGGLGEAAFPDFGPEDCVMKVGGRCAGRVLNCDMLARCQFPAIRVTGCGPLYFTRSRPFGYVM